MRKGLYLLSVVIIAGLLAISYFITGVRAEKEFHQFLEAASGLPNMTVSLDHYERGWLKSTAHVKVVLHQQGIETVLPAQDISFAFDTTVYHGPIIISRHKITFGLGYVRADVPLPDEVLKTFNDVFTPESIKPTFTVALLLKYRDRLLVDFDVPPFALYTKNDTGFMKWNGFDSHWIFSDHLTRMKGWVNLEGLAVENKLAKTQGALEGVALKYDVRRGTDGLLAGNAALDFKKLVVNKSSVEGFKAVSENDIKDNVVDSSLKVDVSKVVYDDVDYGPGVLDLAVSDLDAETLGHIKQQLRAVNSDHLTMAQQRVLMLSLWPELSTLLSKGAVFEMQQFQLSMPDGLLVGMAKLSLPKQKNNTPLNLFQLIHTARFDATVEAPASWLRKIMIDVWTFRVQQHQAFIQQQLASGDTAFDKADPANKVLSSDEINTLAQQKADEQLAVLTQQALLIQKNNTYNTEMHFQDGQLMVNKKPFNGQAL